MQGPERINPKKLADYLDILTRAVFASTRTCSSAAMALIKSLIVSLASVRLLRSQGATSPRPRRFRWPG